MSDVFIRNSDEESLSVVLLHNHPELMKQCCDLVNEEWPRSETARMLSLQSSCDKMPTCLVLLNGEKKVIGHCKLTPIPSIKQSCFMESVVISKCLRGQGMGTFLMQAIEKYCRLVLNLKTIHLSTKGQEMFYKKLGYEICEPVTIYGNFSQNPKVKNNVQLLCKVPEKEGNSKEKSAEKEEKSLEKEENSKEPPAPPPFITGNTYILSKTSKTFMVKSILL